MDTYSDVVQKSKASFSCILCLNEQKFISLQAVHYTLVIPTCHYWLHI